MVSSPFLFNFDPVLRKLISKYLKRKKVLFLHCMVPSCVKDGPIFPGGWGLDEKC